MDWVSLVGTGQGSIARFINHSAVSTNVNGDAINIIQETEAAIYRRLRHFRMLTPTTGTMTTSQVQIPLPADYLEDKTFYITGTAFSKLTRQTIQEVHTRYCYDGSGNRVITQPNFFFSDQTNFNFDSPCDQPYPYELYYYQQPLALSATNTQNFLLTTYPRLFRCMTMAMASEYMKDSGMGNYDRTYWVQMSEEEIEVAQAESDRQERSLAAGMILT